MVGTGAINIFAFGVFLKPVTEELGVARGALSSALFVNTLLNAFACPVVGWLIDRWGTRRIMMPGLLLFALAVAGYGLMQARPPFLMYAIFGIAGLTGGVQTPVPYSAIVTQWFDRQRGIALGIATAGVGLDVAIIPRLAAYLISRFGWRQAYFSLAIAIVIVAWIPVSILIREPPALRQRTARRYGTALTQALPGTQAADALKSRRFCTLAVAFFLAVTAINGTLTHVVALLTDQGVSLQVASEALSVAGLAIIFGRIISGWCLDRYWGPYVAACLFAVPMVGIALLGSGTGSGAPLIGAALCGMGIGVEIDVMAYFISRYFG